MGDISRDSDTAQLLGFRSAFSQRYWLLFQQRNLL